MKSTFFTASIVIAVASASGALAFPLVKRAADPVTTVLQFALTLEHLENAFYSQALGKFDAAAFAKAGFPEFVRGRFEQIAEHEATHVSTLQGALGSAAPAPCTYSFPYNDPNSFASLAMTLEGVGSSAYLGSAGNLVSSPAVLQVAGAILPIEARHNGWITSSVLHQQPWNGAFETPLGPNQVFTLASGFITSCPASNPTLPFKAFPSLVFEGSPAPGQKSTVDFNATSTGESLFVAFLSGLNSTFVPLDGKTVTVPKGLQGTVYAVVTNNGSASSDANTVAGPAILQFPFSSQVSNS
ncbi:hypothetical protein SCHPADRAFT_820755 [Schizopora paradoxa]|uniref:Ferritin-like domain-containing protein n=1 Tax=Schizopora paradoxa TaxID=27342 RepID=A0A0H2S0E2_9AGAM|nr:hypothetical protein SCHPADRAFT_820755 [Schizopora paradoxa]